MYIGIDPSLTSTGMVKNDGKGSISRVFKPKTRGVERLDQIAKEVMGFIDNELGIYVICIEGFAYGAKGKSVFEMGGLGWILRLEMYRKGFGYYDIAPATLKKFATGRGNAKKHEVAVDVQKRWGFEAKTDDEIDAFVLAKIAQATVGGHDLTGFQQKIVMDVIKSGVK